MKHLVAASLVLAAAVAPLFAAKVPATVIPVDNLRLDGRPVLVPEVQEFKPGSGVFALPKAFTVALPASESLIVEQLADALKRFGVEVSTVPDAAKAVCRFELSENGTPKHPQGYNLVIGKEGIRVTARTATGLFYGAQTLRSLIRNAAKPELDRLAIGDWPDFDRRGYFLTIRNMKSKQLPAFKRSLDAMASLKMNWLLLSIEEAFPYKNNLLPKRRNSFTVEEMKDLLEFCRRRHIELTPSMQLWSHAVWMSCHPDWDKMTEGSIERKWNEQCCPHSPEARALTEQAVKEQIELFRPEVFFMMTDEIFLGPYGQCPRCKQDPDLAGTYVKFLKFLESTVTKHGVRPMVCQDSYEDHRWSYGKTLREALDPKEMILWWSYRDRIPAYTMELFKDFQLVGHSLTGKPFNTQNMLRAVRANGGRDSTVVYWYYSGDGQFTNLKRECPDSLGGFVNGLDYMWKYRETPYWQLAYDGTREMIRRLQPEKAAPATCEKVAPIPLENAVNDELGGTGRFPVLDDKALAELTKVLAARPEKFRLLTAPGGKYYAMALTGTRGKETGRVTIAFTVNRSAKALALLLTAAPPTLNAAEYRSAGVYGKKRWEYAPAAQLEFFYEDGKRVDVPLRYRWDFTDWNRPFGGFNTAFAVRGTDANEAHYNFCAVTVPNPRPEAKIVKIHYSTRFLDGVVPAILAASLIGADKPYAPRGPLAFKPDAVASRSSALPAKAANAAPEIRWFIDFGKGMPENAKVVTRDRFPRDFAKVEFVDDPGSPAGGKVMKITILPCPSKPGKHYQRLDVDIPVRVAPDTKSLCIDVKMTGGTGFSHSNLYLAEKDLFHHWGGNFRCSEKWRTIPLSFSFTKDLASAQEKLRGLDKVEMVRITFFFNSVRTPAEIRIGRVGSSPEDAPLSLFCWKVGTEAEPL